MKSEFATFVLGAVVCFSAQAFGQTTGGVKPAPIDVKGLPAGIVAESAPPGPVSSPKVIRSKAKKGDRIAVTGRIGGSAVPWVKDRAMFTLVGDELESCSDHAMDGCPQPWDYCCEPKSEIAQCSATVQINDPKGKLLRIGLKGKAGLSELSDLTVIGVVQAIDDKTLVIAAESIFLWPTLPAGWAIGNAPEQVLTPSQARAGSKVGDEVAVRGRIGGSEDPIANAKASFTIVGSEIAYAADAEKAWSYPATDKSALAAAMCEIKFVDASGDALNVELDGRRNIQPGAEVVVIGIVGKKDDGEFVIHAKKVIKP